MSVARCTFVGLGVEALTAGLVFKLVIFTEEAATEGTPEDASSMVPDGSLALGTLGVLEGAGARVGRQTLPPVAHPRLTEIAYGAHHLKTCCELTRVLDDTVTRLHHALRLAAVSAHWQTLDSETKVAERPVLLPPFTQITFHRCIARPFAQGTFKMR